MKFIITESKLKKMIFDSIENVINQMSLNREIIDNFIVYIFSEEFDDFGFDEVVIEYDFEDGRLYVQKKYFENVLNLFGSITEDEQKEIFSEWFEYYEGIKPNYIYLDINVSFG
jgi:hypothetical protein